MRRFLTKVMVVVLAAGVSAVAAQDRVARTPSGASEAQAQRVSQGQAVIDRAAAAQKYIFIFFYAAEDSHTSAMKSVFDTAMAKMTDRAESIAINIADPAEKPIVDKFGARGAPMPVVLAIAPTGAATRAFPKQFDEAQFQQAFVSPCTAKCMKAIQDRRMILLCVQNGSTQFNREAMQGIKAFKADSSYGSGTEVVMLDPADKAEQHFLSDLQVDPRTTTAVTLLVTPPGAPVARFAGAVTKDEITAKVKEAESGCGAGCSCHKR
jgi:hypothetical protein